MKFKFVPTLKDCYLGQKFEIDGELFSVVSWAHDGKSAIVSGVLNGRAQRIQLIVNNNEPVKELKNELPA